MAIEINERTVEDAMAQAETQRDGLAQFEYLSNLPVDFVLLADEVLRLRDEVERLQGLLKG